MSKSLILRDNFFNIFGKEVIYHVLVCELSTWQKILWIASSSETALQWTPHSLLLLTTWVSRTMSYSAASQVALMAKSLLHHCHCLALTPSRLSSGLVSWSSHSRHSAYLPSHSQFIRDIFGVNRCWLSVICQTQWCWTLGIQWYKKAPASHSL